MAKGQATAIGALFFVMVMLITLSYLVWSVIQLEDLQSTISTYYERQREKMLEDLEVPWVRYYVEQWGGVESYRVEAGSLIGSPNVPEDTNAAGDGKHISVAATPLVPGGYSTLVNYYDFSTDSQGWVYAENDPYDIISGNWGTGGVSSDGAIYVNGSDGEYGAVGYWSKQFQVTRLPERALLDYWYIIKKNQGSGRWSIHVYLVTPGNNWVLLDNTVSGEFSAGWVNRGSVEIDGSVFSSTGTYTLVFECILNVTSPTYDGALGLDNINMTLIHPASGLLSNMRYYAAVELDLDVPSNAIQLTFTGGTYYNSVPVDQLVFVYDYNSSCWRLIDYLRISSTSTSWTTWSASNASRYVGENGFKALVIAGSTSSFTMYIDYARVNYTVAVNTTTVRIENKGPVPAHIVNIWINNATHHSYFTRDVWLTPGEAADITINYRLTQGSWYLIKVVAESGRIYKYFIGVVTAPAPAPGPEEYSLTVTILDSAGYPLQGYPVTVDGHVEYTNENGVASFTLPSGTYNLSVEPVYDGRDFIEWSDGLEAAWREVDLAENSSFTATYKVKTLFEDLSYDGEYITGRLVDEHGNSVSSETVHLYYYSDDWYYIDSTETGVDGGFQYAWSYVTGATKIKAEYNGGAQWMNATSEISITTALLHVNLASYGRKWRLEGTLTLYKVNTGRATIKLGSGGTIEVEGEATIKIYVNPFTTEDGYRGSIWIGSSGWTSISRLPVARIEVNGEPVFEGDDYIKRTSNLQANVTGTTLKITVYSTPSGWTQLKVNGETIIDYWDDDHAIEVFNVGYQSGYNTGRALNLVVSDEWLDGYVTRVQYDGQSIP